MHHLYGYTSANVGQIKEANSEKGHVKLRVIEDRRLT